MQELTDKRTLNGKKYILDNGRQALDVSLGPVHYKDANGAWQNIDNTIAPGVAPNYYSMVGDSYRMDLLQTKFNQGQVIQFSSQGESIKLQPMNLEWTNNLNQIQMVSSPSAAIGVVTNSPSELLPGVQGTSGEVKWTGAYGTGLDFVWRTAPGRLEKNLVIDSLANLPSPTAPILAGGNPVLRLSLIFAPSSGLDIYVDGILWNKSTTKTTLKDIEFRKNGQVLWGFAPLLYWDSSDKWGQSAATLRKAGNNLYIEIRVPYSWLTAASFPVYVDTTIDVQVGADEDDFQGYWDGSAWQGSTTDGSFQVGWYGTSPNIQRLGAGWRFAGITIPAGVTIDTAYLQVYAQATCTVTTVRSYITGDKENDPAAWSTLADFQARRGTVMGGANNNYLTTAQVAWDSIGTWTIGNWYNSPEIKTIIQELVNAHAPTNEHLAGWWDDFNDRTSHNSSARRYGRGYGLGSATSTQEKLHIEYYTTTTVTPGTASLTLTAYAPTVTVTPADLVPTMQLLYSTAWANTTDWEFSENPAPGDPFIQTSTFVSAPSALQMRAVNTPNSKKPWVGLCTRASTLSVPEGRIVSQVNPNTGVVLENAVCLVFRAQAPLGAPASANCYFVSFAGNDTLGGNGAKWYYKNAAGTNTAIGSWSWPYNAGWQKVRVSWWNGANGAGTAATVCRLERWDGSAWATCGTDLYDTNQRNKSSSVNRVGVGPLYIGLTGLVYWDDTEIYLGPPVSAPINTRVTGLVHRWSPGNYKLEIFRGGLSSAYFSPLSSNNNQPTPTVPAPTPNVQPNLSLAAYGQWLSQYRSGQIAFIGQTAYGATNGAVGWQGSPTFAQWQAWRMWAYGG